MWNIMNSWKKQCTIIMYMASHQVAREAVMEVLVSCQAVREARNGGTWSLDCQVVGGLARRWERPVKEVNGIMPGGEREARNGDTCVSRQAVSEAWNGGKGLSIARWWSLDCQVVVSRQAVREACKGGKWSHASWWARSVMEVHGLTLGGKSRLKG
jgi:hypothetical protein